MGRNRYGDGVAWARRSLIGKGSYGRVYLATLKKKNIPAKSKSSTRFPYDLMAVKSSELYVSDSIQKEKEIMTDLNGSPYLIHCFGEETTIGDYGVAYNLLMEYASGGTLADRIKKSGGNGLPESEVKEYTRCILRGLNHIHSNGYVHCDLKPENILLVPNNDGRGQSSATTEFTAKIGDFGFAKREISSNSNKRRIWPYTWRGTPMYLSPEAVIDNVQDAVSDVWALGCIVLEMLTGKPAWDGTNTNEILKKIRTYDELPEIPREMISKTARDFLKCSLFREATLRPTLLEHPFVGDCYELCDDDASEEEEEESYAAYWGREVREFEEKKKGKQISLERCSKRMKHCPSIFTTTSTIHAGF